MRIVCVLIKNLRRQDAPRQDTAKRARGKLPKGNALEGDTL